MKTEQECEVYAKAKLEEYIDWCECNKNSDVLLALQKMMALALHAFDIITNETIHNDH